MLPVPVSRIEIGDSVICDDAVRQVHAIVPADWDGRPGRAVHFTDGHYHVFPAEHRLTVTEFRPATDAEFEGL
jgi:hypothetical protein